MTLVVEKPFKWQGRDFKRGDVLDPAPDGRKTQQLFEQRRVRYENGPAVDAKTPPPTFPCDDCEFVATSANTLDNHWKANHLDASPPAPADASPVSVSPGAPEPAGVEPSLAPAGALACPDCDRSFSGAQGLKVHRSRAHAGA